jgi:hypothetical protein
VNVRSSIVLPRNQVLIGDARQLLRRLPSASVDCVVTSPPYFLLRDYGVTSQIGLEDSVENWVDELRLVMRGLTRVLKPTGTLWLNLGDTYSRHSRYGAPPKSLLLGPERLVLRLIADGWVLRNKLIWAKTNPTPSSVRDRLSCTWEVIYLLARSRTYYFDLDAIRVPTVSRAPQARSAERVSPGTGSPRPAWAGPLAGSNVGLKRLKAAGRVGHHLGKNPGDVWTLAASNYRGGHYATFNDVLVRRLLLAGCPERVCAACGSPWQQVAGRRRGARAVERTLEPTCSCHRRAVPGLVLDPFFGVGTVGLVAESLGRDWLGIEVNARFARLARERIEKARPVKGEQPAAA